MFISHRRYSKVTNMFEMRNAKKQIMPRKSWTDVEEWTKRDYNAT